MKKVYIGFFLGLIFLVCVSVLVNGFNEGLKKETVASKEEEKTTVKDFDLSKINGEFKIKLYRSKTDKIIELSLEEYTLGVVSAEMPAEFPLEALKAQAVAARTYALAHVEEFGGTSSPGAKGGNLIDTVANQVYYSKEERLAGWKEEKRDEYWEKIKKAVDDTNGEVLTYDGKLVLNPYFFSTSSGKTEDGVSVFNINLPYLKSVESDGEEDSPKFEAVTNLKYSDVIKTLNEKYNDSLQEDSDLEKDIKILNRTAGGSVDSIKVGKVIIKGTEFRKLLNLNSANFSLQFGDGIIKIDTRGYGHGVGMSQWGARTMAKIGKNYIDILEHYYSGILVKSVDFKNERYIDIN